MLNTQLLYSFVVVIIVQLFHSTRFRQRFSPVEVLYLDICSANPEIPCFDISSAGVNISCFSPGLEVLKLEGLLLCS